MRYQTVRDILDFVRDFHARASRLFESAAGGAQQQKARWLLDWLAEHERRFAQSMTEFEQAPENAPMLREWLQYAPELERIPLELPRFKSDMTVDDAVSLAFAFDDYLVQLYQAVLTTCGSREICDLFKTLLDQERAEERSIARNLAQLQDL